nr:putative reverse transcriptase domain, ribonuclease H-like domain, aspartic peptidase domain protein [Tanacetum cinerariifolium]
MEKELWILILKGDDVEAYNNRFHGLTLMCPDLVTPERKKIERYIRGRPEKVKANITTSKPASIHDAINMAREIVDQAIQAKNPNMVTGTFLLNDHYASILFDLGAKISFKSIAFTPSINIAHATLNTSYQVELTEGKVVITNTVLSGCTLALFYHVFKIDLLPTRLGSFDVIVGMDWLSYHFVVTVCYEKIVRIPLSNRKILEIQGLPPVCEIKFCIDLIPGVLQVVKSPYRLAPFEMLELSNQLKRLQEKGFIRLGNVVNKDGIYVDPSKVESVKNWKTPDTPRCEQMYYDLRDLYWWPGIKKDIAKYVSMCLTFSKIKIEHQKPSGQLQQPEIPKWKWENITIDLVTRLPRSSSGYDAIWIIVDRLTKSAYFLLICKDFKMERLARIYINEIVKRHGVPMLIISNHDGRFMSHFWRALQKALGTRLDMSTAYHPQTDGKLAPRYVGLFEIVECVGPVAYRLRLPQELSCIHDTFHASNIKKCLAEIDLQVPLEDIKIDDKMYFVEEPIKIVDMEIKKLKRSLIPLVKVRWNSR